LHFVRLKLSVILLYLTGVPSSIPEIRIPKNSMKIWFLLPLLAGCALGTVLDLGRGAIARPNDLPQPTSTDATDACQTPALCSVAKVDRSRGRPIAAILADLDRVVAQYPTDPVGYKIRFEFRQLNQDYRGALADVEQVLRLNPKDTHLYYDRIWLKEQTKGDPQAILRDYDQLVAAYPQAGAFYQRAGFKAEGLKDFQGALKDYDQAIAQVGNNASYFWNSAIGPGEMQADRAELKHYHLLDFKGALPDYDWAIKLNPRPYSYYHRGQLKATHLNDRQGAIADLTQFLQMPEQENAPKAWGQDVELAKATLARLKAQPLKVQSGVNATLRTWAVLQVN
jgi:tetratricopeptide (TPR) repeat protein